MCKKGWFRVLLKCVGVKEATIIIKEIHSRIYGSHLVGIKMVQVVQKKGILVA